MLVFLDSKGAVTATAPSTTGRNSAAMSTIYIVAPVSGAVMSLSFRLPNGDEVNPDLADTVHNAVEILEGVDLPAGVHVWTYAIPKSVTAISGTVMYTVTTTTESFVATGSGTFVVVPATTKTLPSSAPGANVWEDILAELARIYAEMETVLGDSPVTGLDGLSATVTALLSEIAALIGNTPIESPIGGETTISTLLAWLKDESLRFSEVIGSGSISFAGNLIEAVNTLREISVVKTSDPSRVYATASDGTPASLPYSESPTAYSIPQRDGAGRVKTASPASSADAVDFGTFSDEQERVGNLISALQTAVNQLSRAVVFDNWDTALTELTRLTPSLAEAAENFKIGDAILIRDVDAPDGWVSGYAVSPMPYPGGNNIQNPFDGTNSFTVGWLIISPLEAPKISLDGYATTAEAKALADAAENEAKAYADEKVTGVSDRVDVLDKKVENLRAALSPEYFTTDSSVAYVKEAPATALPFAEVQEVGGMSYALGNLFDAMHMTDYFTGDPLTNATVSDGGRYIEIVGDPTGSYNAINFMFTPGKTYCATYGGTGELGYIDRPASVALINSGVAFTVEEGEIGALCFGSNGGTFTDLMIVEGDSPEAFVPYGQLQNAPVTAMESVGANILDLTPALNNCLIDNGDGTYTLRNINGSRFSAAFPFPLPKESGNIINASAEILDRNAEDIQISCRILGPVTNAQKSSFSLNEGGSDFSISQGLLQLYLYHSNNSPGDYVTFKNPMITLGYGYKGFTPYVKHTLPIPAEVQALEGWGLGVDGSCHNRIVWDPENGVKQYRQEVGIVDMGELAYSMRVSNGRYIFVTSSLRQTIRGFVAGDAPLPAVAVGYRAVKVSDTWVDGDMAYGNASEGYTRIEFVNNAYTDVASFTAAMRGRYLVYALGTPTVTDLTEMLGDDNFIKVEGGGTVTAVNANELAAPTKIEYQLKEATT